MTPAIKAGNVRSGLQYTLDPSERGYPNSLRQQTVKLSIDFRWDHDFVTNQDADLEELIKVQQCLEQLVFRFKGIRTDEWAKM